MSWAQSQIVAHKLISNIPVPFRKVDPVYTCVHVSRFTKCRFLKKWKVAIVRFLIGEVLCQHTAEHHIDVSYFLSGYPCSDSF